MKIVAIIPARYESSRFIGKPLALIDGMSMIERVYKSCLETKLFDGVFVATDDERIFSTVENFTNNVIMTSKSHLTGTDRIAEASKEISADYIVNIQGDEPFINKNILKPLFDLIHGNSQIGIATLFHLINAQESENKNVVKLITDFKGKCLYFSRASIPFLRDKSDSQETTHLFKKHIGVYAFKKDLLLEITKLKESFLESYEKLEQLRWLENGYSIYAVETKESTLGIDTPEDLILAEEIIQKNKNYAR